MALVSRAGQDKAEGLEGRQGKEGLGGGQGKGTVGGPGADSVFLVMQRFASHA